MTDSAERSSPQIAEILGQPRKCNLHGKEMVITEKQVHRICEPLQILQTWKCAEGCVQKVRYVDNWLEQCVEVTIIYENEPELLFK